MKIFRLLVGMLVLVLALAACGGAGEDTVADDDSATDPATTEAEDGATDVETEEEDANGEPDEGDTGAGDLDALVAAAQEEGSLTVYTSIPEAITTRVGEGFEDAYGVRVDYVLLSDGPLSQRFAGEQDAEANQADFVTAANRRFWNEAIDAGWMATVGPEDVPALADWPEDFFARDTYATVNLQPIGFSYHTELSETAPEEWEDLLDPSFGGGNMQLATADIVPFLVLYDVLSQEYGIEYLEGLRDLEPRVVDSIVPGAQAMAAGEAHATIPGLASVMEPLIESGAPIEFVIPEYTTGVEQYGGVVADALNPNAARLYMHYLLTVDGQELLTGGLAASVLPGVPGAMEIPARYVPYDETDTLEREAELRTAIGQ